MGRVLRLRSVRCLLLRLRTLLGRLRSLFGSSLLGSSLLWRTRRRCGLMLLLPVIKLLLLISLLLGPVLHRRSLSHQRVRGLLLRHLRVGVRRALILHRLLWPVAHWR